MATPFTQRRVRYLSVSDEKLIRLQALRQVLAGRGIDKDKQAAYLGKDPKVSGGKTYWSGVLGLSQECLIR